MRADVSHPILLGLCLALTVPALAACSKASSSGEAVVEQPPPAPAMPPGWAVESDDAIPLAQLPAVEAKLKGKIKALRNTVYDANGHRVQLNVIVAASPVDADHIERSLGEMKAKWAFRRRGEVLYEFVGDSAASDEIRAATSHLDD